MLILECFKIKFVHIAPLKQHYVAFLAKITAKKIYFNCTVSHNGAKSVSVSATLLAITCFCTM